MAVYNLEVSAENLLGAVLQMPEKEFERFFQNARQLKIREAELVKKINEFNLAPEKEKVYRNLLGKFRAEKITPAEHQELIQLTDELERLNVKRLECVAKIAEIRRQPFDKIFAELKIKPKNYG